MDSGKKMKIDFYGEFPRSLLFCILYERRTNFMSSTSCMRNKNRLRVF